MVGTGTNDVTSLEVSSIFIYDAESFVNAHLAKRYQTPVASEPIVTMITADLAIANMMFEKLGEIPNFIQPRYDRAMMMLEKLANGDLLLTSNSTSIVTTGDNFAWSTNINYHSIFSPVLDELDQAADKDQITADKDERVNDYSYTSS
jgi:phage gp36-like protein